VANASILDQVFEVSEDYLGPATERFINRQIETHLKKQPDKLTSRDLDKLIDWIKLSFAMLTNNADIVNEYAKRLSFVADGQPDKALGEEWTHR
jgi:hypothetical protein